MSDEITVNYHVLVVNKKHEQYGMSAQSLYIKVLNFPAQSSCTTAAEQRLQTISRLRFKIALWTDPVEGKSLAKRIRNNRGLNI